MDYFDFPALKLFEATPLMISILKRFVSGVIHTSLVA
jgi:hypothetical protein